MNSYDNNDIKERTALNKSWWFIKLCFQVDHLTLIYGLSEPIQHQSLLLNQLARLHLWKHYSNFYWKRFAVANFLLTSLFLKPRQYYYEVKTYKEFTIPIKYRPSNFIPIWISVFIINMYYSCMKNNFSFFKKFIGINSVPSAYPNSSNSSQPKRNWFHFFSSQGNRLSHNWKYIY